MIVQLNHTGLHCIPHPHQAAVYMLSDIYLPGHPHPTLNQFLTYLSLSSHSNNYALVDLLL